jgi:type IV secretory pathway TraG/TraD family ATPase VirD4
MGMFGSFGRFMGASLSAGNMAANQLNHGLGNMIDNHNVKKAQKALYSDRVALSTGYLFGDDQAGVDSAGLMDYRGLEWPERIAGALAPQSGVVPLGAIKNTRTRFSAEAWLPWEVFNTHTAIIAPPGSGKTHGIVVPWILAFVGAGGRVISNDVKGDLLDNILAAKRDLGLPSFKVTRWDPLDRKVSKCWNPLLEVYDDASRTRIVTALLGDISKTKSQDPFFIERDHRWLDGLIKLALTLEPEANFYDIFQLISNQGDLVDTIEANASISSDIYDITKLSSYDYSLAIGSLMNKLRWLTYDDARYVTKKSDFRLEDIIETPGLLLIGSNFNKGEPAAAATAMIYAMLRSLTFKRFAEKGCLENAWIIDEASVIASRIALDETLSLARSAKLGIALAFQDVTQLGNDEEQNRLLSNCKTLITLRDVSDATAQYFSKRLGKHTIQKITASLDMRGRHMPQTSTEQVPILGASEIMHPPIDFGTYCGIVHSPTLGSFCSPPAVTNKPYIVDFAR